MTLLRSFVILLALGGPVPAQDGRHDADRAAAAARALELYLGEVATAGGRPDYTKPPASGLLSQIFNLQALAALPPANPGDLPWLLDWTQAANRANVLMTLFGLTPGDSVHAAAVVKRNQTEYEDQCAAAISFLIRLEALELAPLSRFMVQLPPEQRTPVREAGLRKARRGAAEMLAGSVIWIAQGMKPDNARLLAAALRETRTTWAGYMTGEDRGRVLQVLAAVPKYIRDDQIASDLALLAEALKAANPDQDRP